MPVRYSGRKFELESAEKLSSIIRSVSICVALNSTGPLLTLSRTVQQETDRHGM
jgi:hypothetical protein